MKLIVKEYLASLSERGELDRLIPNVLSHAGLTVFSEPMTGGRQHGVDVAAFGRFNGCVEEKVYLLAIKPQELTRSSWNSDVDSLRPSLDEIIDSYIGCSLPEEYQKFPVVICLCIGGEISQVVQGDVKGYIEGCRKRNATISYEVWEGDKLAELCVKYLMDDRLAVTVKSNSLGRCISLPDETDYYLDNFRRLVAYVLSSGSTARTSSPEFHITTLNLCLAILFYQGKVANNLNSVYLAAEYALWRAWRHLKLGDSIARKSLRLELFDQAYKLFLNIGKEYFLRIKFAIVEPYLFALSVSGASDEVDVNLKAFDILGRIASYTLALEDYSQSCLEPVCSKENVEELVLLVAQMIANVHTLNTPLLDNQVHAVCLAVKLLLRHGKQKEVSAWIFRMADSILGCLIIRKGFPTVGLDYEQLLDHVHGSHDERYLKDVWAGSELLSFLYYIAVKLRLVESVQKIKEIRNHFSDDRWQIWFPDAATEENLGEMTVQATGRMFYPISTNDDESFMTMFSKIASMNMVRFSTDETPYSGLIYLGCKESALPLPPWMWS